MSKKEYKTWHDWEGKVVHWKLGLKFDQKNKGYMVYVNEMHNVLSDFNIQIDHLISARRSDQVIINKKRKLAENWTLLSRRTTK